VEKSEHPLYLFQDGVSGGEDSALVNKGAYSVNVFNMRGQKLKRILKLEHE